MTLHVHAQERLPHTSKIFQKILSTEAEKKTYTKRKMAGTSLVGLSSFLAAEAEEDTSEQVDMSYTWRVAFSAP